MDDMFISESPDTVTGTDSWLRDGFGELYPVVYAHRTVEAALPEAQFAMAQCRLQPTDRLLDLCCGNGRHLVHLARHTHYAFGLDYSAPLLNRAKTLFYQNPCAQVTLCRADMKAIPFQDNTFDVITNFFTSFGYFDKDSDNNRVLAEIARVLKPGGRFFMDHMNPDHVRATLVPESTRESDGYLIKEHRWIDAAQSRVKKETRVFRENRLVGEWVESVRMYACAELTDLLHQAGLDVTEVAGNYPNQKSGHSRQILTGRKG